MCNRPEGRKRKFCVPHCSIKPPVNPGFIFDASCNGTTREGVSRDHGLSAGQGYADDSLKPHGESSSGMANC
jgi:hypothetical protein